MGAKHMTQDVYDRLVAAFLSKPGNIESASREVGINWRTAKIAYEKGYPKGGFAPIRATVEQAHIMARNMLEAQREAERRAEGEEKRRARNHAIKTMAEEGEAVEISRSQTLDLLRSVMVMSKSAQELGKTLKNYLAVEDQKLAHWVQYDAFVSGLISTPVAKPKFEKPDYEVPDLVNLLQRVATLSSTIVNTARQCMEMERLYLGKPTNIIGLEQTRELTQDELIVRRDAAVKAIDASLEKKQNPAKALEVIAGGKSEPKIGKRVIVPSGAGDASS